MFLIFAFGWLLGEGLKQGLPKDPLALGQVVPLAREFLDPESPKALKKQAEDLNRAFEDSTKRIIDHASQDAALLVRRSHVAGGTVITQMGREVERSTREAERAAAKTLATPLKIEIPSVPDIRLFADTDAILDVSGLVWSYRQTGQHYPLSFVVRDAAKLHLRLGGVVYEPAQTATAGETAFEVPVTAAIQNRFHDFEFQTLTFDLLNGPKGSVRHSGKVRLAPVFPTAYRLRVFAPGDGPAGQTRSIDQGPAMDALIDSVDGEPLERATRHGWLHHAAKTHLPVGSSRVTIPKHATWTLTVRLPGGDDEVLSEGNLSTKNKFGSVTVTPVLTDDWWALEVNTAPKD